MPRIFLVGFMGAGKSSAGAALAARMGCRFVDLDDRIRHRFGVPIPEIFARHGETVFRTAESDELARCAELDGVVVATGGGAFCSEDNRQVIHDSGGVSVFLDLPWSELELRLAGEHSDRPMWDGSDQARHLFEQRLPHYRRAAVTVALDGNDSPDEVAERVQAALREVPCAP
jgi:shikimate kinase